MINFRKSAALFAALAVLLSSSACSGNKAGEKADTSVGTTAESTPVTNPGVKLPQVIDIADVRTLISSVKAEYNANATVTLSDGTVISTAVKDPDITAAGVADGTVTDEQKNAYVKYVANIRAIVCDRIAAYFPEENKASTEGSSGNVGIFMFLDPVSEGFSSAEAALGKLSYSKGIPMDYILIEKNTAYFCNSDTGAAELLCPNPTENEILMAIMQSAS